MYIEPELAKNITKEDLPYVEAYIEKNFPNYGKYADGDIKKDIAGICVAAFMMGRLSTEVSVQVFKDNI